MQKPDCVVKEKNSTSESLIRVYPKSPEEAHSWTTNLNCKVLIVRYAPQESIFYLTLTISFVLAMTDNDSQTSAFTMSTSFINSQLQSCTFIPTPGYNRNN
jgi:hypothetical protein